jgi:hypothetical protein
MSDEPRHYSPLYIRAWTALAIAHGVVFYILFAFGTHFMAFGQVVWHLLRWICSPII